MYDLRQNVTRLCGLKLTKPGTRAGTWESRELAAGFQDGIHGDVDVATEGRTVALACGTERGVHVFHSADAGRALSELPSPFSDNVMSREPGVALRDGVVYLATCPFEFNVGRFYERSESQLVLRWMPDRGWERLAEFPWMLGKPRSIRLVAGPSRLVVLSNDEAEGVMAVTLPLSPGSLGP